MCVYLHEDHHLATPTGNFCPGNNFSTVWSEVVFLCYLQEPKVTGRRRMRLRSLSASSPRATLVTFTVGAISGFCLPFFFWCRGFFWHRERRGTLGPSVGDISRCTDRVDVNILIVFSSWLCCQGCEPAPRVSSKCYTTSILKDLHVCSPLHPVLMRVWKKCQKRAKEKQSNFLGQRKFTWM